MTLGWTPFGLPGLVAAIVAWSAAVFVLRTTPNERVRRRLALLLFALAPIQRAAERISDTAMPNVQDTPEFRKFRKLQIYGQAFSDSRCDGGPNAVQRVALDRLREELELPAGDVAQLEARLAGS